MRNFNSGTTLVGRRTPDLTRLETSYTLTKEYFGLSHSATPRVRNYEDRRRKTLEAEEYIINLVNRPDQDNLNRFFTEINSCIDTILVNNMLEFGNDVIHSFLQKLFEILKVIDQLLPTTVLDKKTQYPKIYWTTSKLRFVHDFLSEMEASVVKIQIAIAGLKKNDVTKISHLQITKNLLGAIRTVATVLEKHDKDNQKYNSFTNDEANSAIRETKELIRNIEKPLKNIDVVSSFKDLKQLNNRLITLSQTTVNPQTLFEIWQLICYLDELLLKSDLGHLGLQSIDVWLESNFNRYSRYLKNSVAKINLKNDLDSQEVAFLNESGTHSLSDEIHQLNFLLNLLKRTSMLNDEQISQIEKLESVLSPITISLTREAETVNQKRDNEHAEDSIGTFVHRIKETHKEIEQDLIPQSILKKLVVENLKKYKIDTKIIIKLVNSILDQVFDSNITQKEFEAKQEIVKNKITKILPAIISNDSELTIIPNWLELMALGMQHRRQSYKAFSRLLPKMLSMANGLEREKELRSRLEFAKELLNEIDMENWFRLFLFSGEPFFVFPREWVKTEIVGVNDRFSNVEIWEVRLYGAGGPKMNEKSEADDFRFTIVLKDIESDQFTHEHTHPESVIYQQPTKVKHVQIKDGKPIVCDLEITEPCVLEIGEGTIHNSGTMDNNSDIFGHPGSSDTGVKFRIRKYGRNNTTRYGSPDIEKFKHLQKTPGYVKSHPFTKISESISEIWQGEEATEDRYATRVITLQKGEELTTDSPGYSIYVVINGSITINEEPGSWHPKRNNNNLNNTEVVSRGRIFIAGPGQPIKLKYASGIRALVCQYIFPIIENKDAF